MWAAAEAELRGSTLFLVHAVETDGQAPFLSQAEIVRSRQGEGSCSTGPPRRSRHATAS
ncbi:hypothetical protein [Streptomyces narbonensis]